MIVSHESTKVAKILNLYVVEVQNKAYSKCVRAHVCVAYHNVHLLSACEPSLITSILPVTRSNGIRRGVGSALKTRKCVRDTLH